MATIDESSVKAVLNTMPPTPHSLYVTGMAEETITLKAAVPQGFNPLVLILEISSASGQAGPFRYDEKPAKHDYTDVHIRASDGDIKVKVQRVS